MRVCCARVLHARAAAGECHCRQLHSRWLSDTTRRMMCSYHETRLASVAHCLSSSEWEGVQSNLRKAPMMVIPLPKVLENGATSAHGAFVTFLSQAQLPQHLLITSLADYQSHGPSAAPHLVVTVFSELAGSKDLVLLRGDIVSPVMITGKADASCLLDRFLALYCTSDWFDHFVLTFNKSPSRFEFDNLVALWK
jgi:ATP synthase mitochondrial F1 complex assembly factor 1